MTLEAYSHRGELLLCVWLACCSRDRREAGRVVPVTASNTTASNTVDPTSGVGGAVASTGVVPPVATRDASASVPTADGAAEECVPSIPGYGDPSEPPWHIPPYEFSAANPPDLCGPCGRWAPRRVSGEKYIHALGFGSDGESGAIRVHGDYLYWAQWTAFFRGRKDGEGRPELIGELAVGIGSDILMDGEYIYWLDATVVRATKLETMEFREADIKLSAYYGDFAQDDEHLYLADTACKTIRQVSKSTLDVVRDYTLELPEGGAPGGGTTMAVDDTNIYCANLVQTYVQPKAGGEPLILGAPATRISIFGDTGARMYWRTRESGTLYSNLGYIDKATLQAVLVGQTPGSGGGYLTFDAARRTLFWNSRDKVISFDIDREQFGVHAWFRSNYSGTADDDFIYFGERVYGEPCDPVTEIGTITRFPKDSPAEPWPWVPVAER